MIWCIEQWQIKIIATENWRVHCPLHTVTVISCGPAERGQHLFSHQASSPHTIKLLQIQEVHTWPHSCVLFASCLQPVYHPVRMRKGGEVIRSVVVVVVVIAKIARSRVLRVLPYSLN